MSTSVFPRKRPGCITYKYSRRRGHACAKSTCSPVVISQLLQGRILPTLPQTSSIAQQPSSLIGIPNLLVWCPFTYSTQTGVTVRGRNRNSIRAGHHRPLTLPSNHFTGACLQVTVTHNRAFLLSLQFSEKNAWTSLRDIRLYLAISILIMQYRL